MSSFYPKRTGTKRKYYGTSTSAAPAAKRVKYARPMLTRYIRPTQSGEMKYIDANQDIFADNNAASNNSIILLNGMSAGAAMWQRIGRKATLKAVNLTYTIQPYNIPAASDRIKVSLVFDRMPTGFFPVHNEVFLSQNSAGTALCDPESQVNLNNRDRFRILHTKTYAVGGVLSSGEVVRTNLEASELHFKRYIKCNLPITFKADGNLLGDISGGALYILVQALTATSATQTWTVHYNARMMFSDQ